MTPARGESRATMIAAMRDLVLTKGFAATTIDEVCEQASVSKGSFYHHFSSKDEMGMAALDSYFDDLVAALHDADLEGIEDPVDRLHAFVDHVAEVCAGPVVRNGCILGVFALEAAEHDPDIRSVLNDRFAQLAAAIAGIIADAAESRRRTVDAGLLADHLLTIIEGAIVLAKSRGDTSVVGRQVRVFDEHLRLLLDAPVPGGSR